LLPIVHFDDHSVPSTGPLTVPSTWFQSAPSAPSTGSPTVPLNWFPTAPSVPSTSFQTADFDGHTFPAFGRPNADVASDGLLQILIYPFALLLLKDPWQGAQTSSYCAVAEEVKDVSGKHFVDCKMKDPPLPLYLNQESAEKLWKISTSMTNSD